MDQFQNKSQRRVWADIDLKNPLNVNHPLNNKRQSWWITMPGRSGPNVWFDLVAGLGAVFTVTPATPGSVWSVQTNPGGLGSFLFLGNGGSSSGSYFLANPYPYLGNITFLTWIRRGGQLGINSNAIASHAPITQSAGDWFIYYTSSNTLSIDIPFVLGNVVTGSTVFGNTTSWHRVGFSRSGISGSWKYTIWVDGKSDGTASTASNPLTTNSRLGLGAYTPGPFYSNCYLNDIAIYPYAFDANLAALDYNVSRNGYVGVFNRRRRNVATLAPPPPPPPPPPAGKALIAALLPKRTIIGSGIY